MKIIELWACLKNQDQTEGRGPMEVVCYAKDESTALEIVNLPVFWGKHGVQGCRPYGDGKYDVSLKSLLIFDSVGEYVSHSKDEKVKKALAKLTTEDKRLLGLE